MGEQFTAAGAIVGLTEYCLNSGHVRLIARHGVLHGTRFRPIVQFVDLEHYCYLGPRRFLHCVEVSGVDCYTELLVSHLYWGNHVVRSKFVANARAIRV